MKQKLINIIASPFFIAFVLFAIVFIFIPKDLFKKYKLIQVSNNIENREPEYIFYKDFDCDGYSEKIRRYIDDNKMNAMNVYSAEGPIIDQFNFGREAVLRRQLFALDRDGNKLKEVYTLSHINDSIFLNWVEPMNESDNLPHSRFVTTMNFNKYGIIDYTAVAFACADLDNDGNKEVVFTVNGGYSKFPRKVFAYDFKKDSVYSSPFTGVATYISDIVDINNDGFVEILLNTSAYANIQPNDSILDDQHSYIMVLDHNLGFLFQPIPFFGYPSNIHVFPAKHKNEWNIVARFSLTGKNGGQSKILIYNSNGQKINEKKIENGTSRLMKIDRGENANFALYNNKNGSVKFYDLELNETFNKALTKGMSIEQFDLDGDGIYEWIAKDRNYLQTITVFRQDFTHPSQIKLPVPGGRKYIFKMGLIKKGEKSLLHIQKDENNFVYDYRKNNFHYLKFPFYFGIYLVLLLIVFIIQRLTKYQAERKLALEKQISELQLKTIRSQMDPHFTFNALNTISSIIYKEDKEKAHRYFTKFSKLVRATLEASDNITRTLGEELDFTENYLLLEKIRFKDKFDYKIDLADNVNKELLVPKMIIQIYVENAIKHGLKHKEKDGLLKIDISYNKRGRLLPGRSLPGRLLPLKIIIEDNGVGRKKSAELKTFGTGHGMKIMDTIGKLYFKLYKIEISQKVVDLFDDKGNAVGTRVVIEIPQKEE